MKDMEIKVEELETGLFEVILGGNELAVEATVGTDTCEQIVGGNDFPIYAPVGCGYCESIDRITRLYDEDEEVEISEEEREEVMLSISQYLIQS